MSQSKKLLATNYVNYFGIREQKADESDFDFINRVAEVLRENDRVIDAYEVLANKRLATANQKLRQF